MGASNGEHDGAGRRWRWRRGWPVPRRICRFPTWGTPAGDPALFIAALKRLLRRPGTRVMVEQAQRRGEIGAAATLEMADFFGGGGNVGRPG